MRRVAEGVAAAYGAQVEIDYDRGYPVTLNHPDATIHAAEAAREIAGAVDLDVAPLMAGEDFSYMLESRPGAYIFIGNGDSGMLHTAGYNFDDGAIPAGSSWYARMVETRLPVAG